MKVLVINCGSSSIKYDVYDSSLGKFIAGGIVEKVGEQGSFIKHKVGEREIKNEVQVTDHEQGLKLVIKYLLDKDHGAIKNLSEIAAVGHRTVHGGTIAKSTLIDENLVKKMEDLIELAPLHNPPNIMGIKVAQKLLPKVPHVAVFDTAFHQTMPEVAYTYAVPYEYYEKWGVRRYGFHGTSHNYVALEAAKMLKKPLKSLKIITCHLGAGCSMTAVKAGKSIDTSMGFTPLEGLVMGTRSGDLDPALPFFLVEKGISMSDLYKILNEKSGLLGLSGVSKDMREILKNLSKNKRCVLALDVFCYRIKKYIGAYAAALGGLDVLVFTAGIGENEPLPRAKICQGLEFLGIKLDNNKNKKNAINISAKNSKVKVLVIPTDEAKMIALETLRVIKR